MARATVASTVAGGSAPARRPRGRNPIYDARFDLPEVPVSKRYIFFSSQRTGSNYLCHRLSNVKDRFGRPSEYLNPNAIETLAPRLQPKPATGAQGFKLGEYLRGVQRLRTTADGCFGIKVQPRQILPYFPRASAGVPNFLQRYERVIVLTRRDKLSQAVSGSIAEATGSWFGSGNDPDFTDAELADLCPDVASKLNRYIEEERIMAGAAAASGRPVLHMNYEEILADADATFDRVLVFLGEPRGVAGVEETELVPVPRKPAGKVAQRLRKIFLDYISGVVPKTA